MDANDSPTSILDIASTGQQVAVQLFAISWQMILYSDGFSAIGSEISLTASVLQQLGSGMKQDAIDDHGLVFNQAGIDNVQRLAGVCENAFTDIKLKIEAEYVRLRNGGPIEVNKDRLSRIWISRLPSAQTLKENRKHLMLMLQLRLLAIARKKSRREHPIHSDNTYQQDIIGVIAGLEGEPRGDHRQETSAPVQHAHPKVPQRVNEDSQPADRSRHGKIKAYALSKVENFPRVSMVEEWVKGSSQVQSMPSECSSESTIRPSPPAKDFEGNEGVMTVKPEKSLVTQSHQIPEKQSISVILLPSSDEMLLADLKSLLPTEVIDDSASKIQAIDTKGRRDDSSRLSLLRSQAVTYDKLNRRRKRSPSIKLVWKMQNLKLDQSSIHANLDKLESEPHCSIDEILLNLSDYERTFLNKTLRPTLSRPKSNLLALKRTHTNIYIRDACLNLPALDIIIQRPLTKPYPLQALSLLQTAISLFQYCHPLSFPQDPRIISPEPLTEADCAARRRLLASQESSPCSSGKSPFTILKVRERHEGCGEDSSGFGGGEDDSIHPSDSASVARLKRKGRAKYRCKRFHGLKKFCSVTPIAGAATQPASPDKTTAIISTKNDGQDVTNPTSSSNHSTVRSSNTNACAIQVHNSPKLAFQEGDTGARVWSVELPKSVEVLLKKWTTLFSEDGGYDKERGKRVGEGGHSEG